MLGAVYADALKYLEAEGRVCPLKIEPGIPVHTGWDLGVSDSTAIWFIQCVGRNFHAVDYYESSGAPLHHYVEVLHEKRIKRGFRYGQHFLPHDVKNRELNTAMSRIEWKDKQRIWTAYPLHDWASHGADALATFATGYEDPSITQGQHRRRGDTFSTATHWAS
jgi:hypothetical protein